MPAFFASLLPTIGSALMSILFSLMTKAFFKEVILLGLKKGAKSSKAEWDDELVAIVEKHLEGKSDE